MSQPALALLLCLGALVREATASFNEQSTFFKPLTCDQDIAHRHKCGSEAEKFYPNQCLQKKCCYLNNTCYHHIIDGATQRRNAGILGGTCVMVVILGACLFYGCKFREFQRKEKLSEGPESEGNIDDYLVKLLDDESMAESETQDGTASLQGDESWTQQRRPSKQVGWSPEPLELEEVRLQRQWTPETTPESSPEPPPLSLEPPPLSPEPPPPALDAPPPPSPDAPPPPSPDAPPPAPAEPPPP